MKKYLSVLLIIVLMSTMVIGCSQKPDDVKEASNEPASETEVQAADNTQQANPDDILLMLGKARSDVEALYGASKESEPQQGEYVYESYFRIKYDNHILFLDENDEKVYGIIFNEGINGIKPGMKVSDLEKLLGAGTKKVRDFAEMEIPYIEYIFDNYKVGSTGKTMSLALQAYVGYAGDVSYVMAVTREYSNLISSSRQEQGNNHENVQKNNNQQNKKANNNYDSALSLLGATKEKVIEAYGDGEFVDYGECKPYMTYRSEEHGLSFHFDWGETAVEKISLGVNYGSEKIDKVSLNSITLGMKENEAYALATDKTTKKGHAEEVTYEYTVYKINGYDTAIDVENGVVIGVTIEGIEVEANSDANNNTTFVEEKNDWTKGYTFRVVNSSDGDRLFLKYNNTGDEITLVIPTADSDPTKCISNIVNVNKSHDGSKLYFETSPWPTTNAIHVVDLNTFKEKFFTDGYFVKNVGEYPNTNSVIVQKNYIKEGQGRINSYFAIASSGEELCELGSTIESDLVVQIGRIQEQKCIEAESIKKLQGFQQETINSVNIDYSKYTAVVIPQYNGVNKDKLANEVLTNDKYPEGPYTSVNFAVFGDITNVKVLEAESMDHEYEITELNDKSNTLITLNTKFPTDTSNILVKFSVHMGEGMYSDYEFSLDDMRDDSAYKPILVE